MRNTDLAASRNLCVTSAALKSISVSLPDSSSGVSNSVASSGVDGRGSTSRASSRLLAVINMGVSGSMKSFRSDDGGDECG